MNDTTPQTGRQRILNRLQHQPTDTLPFMPITMMFAAKQINAPYRQDATDFNTLVEGQLRTAEKFDIDYVSCISDPAREASDCGANLQYFDDQPPAIDELNALLADKTTLATLKAPAPEDGPRMRDRIQAADLFKTRVGESKLIEGWVEGPCAEAADLRGINHLMMDFYEDPAFVHDLFAFNVEQALRFAKAQLEAGVDLIGIGDAAASLVGPQIYEEFVFPKEKELIDGIHALGGATRIHICGDTRPFLKQLSQLGASMIDLDYMVPIAQAREAMGPEPILCGNLDPVRAILKSTPEDIQAALAQCHQEAGQNYIVGAGCEIPRDTPDENFHALHQYACAN